MKPIIIATGLAIVVGVIVFSQQGNTLEVTTLKERMEEVVKEPMEVPAWQTDEDAVKAAQAVIDRKNTEAELKSVQEKIEELDVTYKASRAELVEQETVLEKKLGTY